MGTMEGNEADHRAQRDWELEETIMTYFINYDADTDHISINTFRNSGYANSDIGGLAEDLKNGTSGNAPLDGALEALEDGAFLSTLDSKDGKWGTLQEAVEALHDALSSFQREA